MLESKLQKKIIQDLKKRGWFVLKVIRCNLTGFNDIVIFRKGITVFLELKALGKTADPIQEIRHEQLLAQGFDVYTVDSFEKYLDLKL